MFDPFIIISAWNTYRKHILDIKINSQTSIFLN